MLEDKAHQENLRIGRFSKTGQFYAITKCCDKKEQLLIPDLGDLSSGSSYFEIFYEAISWLIQNNHISYPSATMMPDHFHLVFQLGESKDLSEVIQSLCKFTAKKYNEMRKISGKFWQTGFYDHAIRSHESIATQINYILENPVRKGLVNSIENWPFKIITYPPISVSR
ncbi:MAG: hypothetical protein D8M58_10455 [Calditrichaeota bacterium]|nr:MAG: hypothetical protein DWQ03_09830 [Calditrichota bacterium]MBL1205811.1 hypothetical protein [Calditrichota bacterium]NOG45639.1 hypothetical protein [Calditrichota bacterium]